MFKMENIELEKIITNKKIVIKGKNLNLQWVSIPTISKNCILVWSENEDYEKPTQSEGKE